MGTDGQPTLAYTSADLSGLSQVFTGLSWYAGPTSPIAPTRASSAATPTSSATGGRCRTTTSTRRTPASTRSAPRPSGRRRSRRRPTPDTVGDVKIALDTLFNNPNVGPFIGKQLIQRLVTSNPSPAYVARVAAAFDNNGSGVRGDMKAVWKAILLDPEARTVGTSTSAGKLREPVLRLAHMLRAFNADLEVSGRYTGIGLTDDPATQPEPDADVRADGVQLLPPGLRAVGRGPGAEPGWSFPRCSSTHELSVAGYMNYIRTWTQLDADPRHPARLRRPSSRSRRRRPTWSSG